MLVSMEQLNSLVNGEESSREQFFKTKLEIPSGPHAFDVSNILRALCTSSHENEISDRIEFVWGGQDGKELGQQRLLVK